MIFTHSQSRVDDELRVLRQGVDRLAKVAEELTLSRDLLFQELGAERMELKLKAEKLDAERTALQLKADRIPKPTPGQPAGGAPRGMGEAQAPDPGWTQQSRHRGGRRRRAVA